MPDTPSEDAFADLFGKLPDPRHRATDADRPVAPGDAAAPSQPPAPVPTSRRAAREAAAQTPAAASDDEPAWTVGERPAPIAVSASPAPEPADSTSTSARASRTDSVPTRTGASAVPPRRRSTADVDPAAVAPVAPSLDELFRAETAPAESGKKPRRRRRRIGGWIALGVVLVLLGGIAGTGLWVWNTYEPQIRALMGWEEPKDYEEGLANGEAMVTVSSGDTGQQISESLYEAGVTKTPEAFYAYLVEEGQNPTFYPGVYRMQLQMTSAAALEALLNPDNKLENSALVREGLTVDETLSILADGLGIPMEDLEAAVADPTAYGVPVNEAVVAAGGQPLEGWLFPAMYTFDPGVTAEQVIGAMVERTMQSLDAAGVPVEDRERILTVASIIQREARFETDFYKVSRVVENRLDPSNQETFGLLQMDSTAQYGYGEDDGTVSTSGDALTDDNPWNTYVHPGLPIGPIANPGDVAIDAAMHPADGPWLYFVTVNLNTGETVFTSTIAEHEQARQQWIAWCQDNPDAGC